MPVASKKPQSYAWIPVRDAPGTLGKSLKPTMAGVETNFNAVQASIRQIIAYMEELKALIPPDMQARVYALEQQVTALAAEVAALTGLALDTALLTAAGGGSTWNLADLDGYPSIRAVIIDPNGEGNTLNLPALTADERLCITIKCISNGGNVTIDAGSEDIVALASVGSSMSLPYAFIADGLTISTYGVTLIWTGVAWHVIDTAIYTA